MDFASGKRLSFHFQIHFRINICSVERDVQAPEFTVRIRGLPSRAVWRLQRFVRRPCALGAVGRYAWRSPTPLTAEKMKKCVWVRPELVARIEFLEWTDADHLRHSKFAGLRDDKDSRNVVKE